MEAGTISEEDERNRGRVETMMMMEVEAVDRPSRDEGVKQELQTQPEDNHQQG